jgi:hypothetical protein
MGPAQSPVQWPKLALYPGVKRLGPKFHNSPQSNSEVRKMDLYFHSTIGLLGASIKTQRQSYLYHGHVNIVPSPPILSTLMMEAIRYSETSVLQEPHVVTSHKTAAFTARVISGI